MDILLKRKCVAFVGRTTLNGIRGRGIRDRVMQLHGLISTSAADTVDPAIHGAMTLEGRLVGDSSMVSS